MGRNRRRVLAAYSGAIARVRHADAQGECLQDGVDAERQHDASYWICAGTRRDADHHAGGGTLTTAPLSPSRARRPARPSGSRSTAPIQRSARHAISSVPDRRQRDGEGARVHARVCARARSPARRIRSTRAGQTGMPLIVPGGGRFATAQVVHITGPAGARCATPSRAWTRPTLTRQCPSAATSTVGHAQILKVRAWLTGSDPSAVPSRRFRDHRRDRSGRQHSLALAADGPGVGLGPQLEGQVGNGTSICRP